MNMHEWMTANPRPDRPQFDSSAMQAAPDHQAYMQDWRGQMGDYRDDLQGWRSDRRDYRQTMRPDQAPRMDGRPILAGGGVPLLSQFPLNPNAPHPQAPQPVPGSGYGFNLADILQRFPNGLGQGANGLPGL